MIRLDRIRKNGWAEICAKLEDLNPGGSVKDRICLAMIEEAERSGKLKEGYTIVEPTSGNTGIGLAMVAAVKGYRLILTMPETMSMERRNFLAAYGAEIVLTPGEEDMKGAVKVAVKIVENNSNCFMPHQFTNLANPEAHRKTTAMEILSETEGKLDAFVAGIGTGGTITGVGQTLKEKLKGVLIVGIEPAKSAVLSGGKPGLHDIQGIGAGFVPEVLGMDVVDEVIAVSDEDAFKTAELIARKEGALMGISSGANVFGAMKIAERLGEGKRVVTILPDTGQRYFSMRDKFLR